MKYKICSMCKMTLPVSAYYVVSKTSTSTRPECKKCSTIRKKKYRTRENEKYKIRYASDSEYRKKRSLQRGHLPMCESKKSAPYLGVYIAENALSRFFDHMERMPRNNPGYDYICGKGYKIDVKSSCLRHRQAKSDIWAFEIGKNTIADYFLCLAFDNRDNLEPMHVWLIPGHMINSKVGIGIANTPGSLLKYAAYERPLDGVVYCCNEMKIAATG